MSVNRISNLRKEQGLSQAELADALCVHQTAVSQWESGKTTPSFALICDMSDFFNVSPTYLMGTSDIRGHFRMTDEEMEESGKAEAERLIEEKKRKRIVIEIFDTLDVEGQLKVLSFMRDLVKIPDYQKDSEK